jgi:hypothetical protein
MQHTGLILSLEKSALQAVRIDLMARQTKSTAQAKKAERGVNLTSSSTKKSFVNNEEDGTNSLQPLTEVTFVDFAIALLQNMKVLPLDKKEFVNYTQSGGFFLQLASIVSVFEAVDVDSRGVIDFQDFTNFCLRLARLFFKPDAKRSLTPFIQNQDQHTQSFPSYKMRFVDCCQVLIVFDSDSPRVRIYG